MLTVEQVQQLPRFNRVTIPPDYLDMMGHMNIRYYLGTFDDGAFNLFVSIGMDQDYYEANNAGAFALKQFIQYWAEVREGETVTVHGRFLGRSEKRVHFMLFMVNETTNVIAATIEVVGAHADLTVRRTSPFAPQIAAKLDAVLAEHKSLDWDAPTCGILGV